MLSIAEQIKGIQQTNQASARFPRSVKLKRQVSSKISASLESLTTQKGAAIGLAALILKYNDHKSRVKSLTESLNSLHELKERADICSNSRSDPATVIEIFVDSAHRSRVLPFLRTWAEVSGENACDAAADEIESYLGRIKEAKIKAAVNLTGMPKDHPALMPLARRIATSQMARKKQRLN